MGARDFGMDADGTFSESYSSVSFVQGKLWLFVTGN
jgi:hypothetical protein